jgi:hypothetical protein
MTDSEDSQPVNVEDLAEGDVRLMIELTQQLNSIAKKYSVVIESTVSANLKNGLLVVRRVATEHARLDAAVAIRDDRPGSEPGKVITMSCSKNAG